MDQESICAPLTSGRAKELSLENIEQSTNAKGNENEQSSGTKPKLTEFHRFKDLPAEICAKVWKNALPGPRIIQVEVIVRVAEHSGHVCGLKLRSANPLPVPALLHACSDSRVTALRFYQLGLASNVSKATCYINFNIDTLYFGKINDEKPFALSCLLRDIPNSELSQIRHLGMHQNLWNNNFFCNCHVLMDFPNLKELTLAYEADGYVSTTKKAAFRAPCQEDEKFITYLPDGNIGGIDDDMECEWPHEAGEMIRDHIHDIYVHKNLKAKTPVIGFKVLYDVELKLRMAKGAEQHKKTEGEGEEGTSKEVSKDMVES